LIGPVGTSASFLVALVRRALIEDFKVRSEGATIAMLPGLRDIGPLLLTLVIPAAIILVVMNRYIRFLVSTGRTTNDAHKEGGVRIPTPAGPLIVVAMVAGEVVAWVFYGTVQSPVLIVVVVCAGLIGLYDDLRGLGGIVKPALLAGLGFIVALAEHFSPKVYDPTLYFPLFTRTGTHYIIFGLIVIASIPVSSNAFNMLDAFNGEISGFTTIVSGVLVIAIILRSYALAETSAASIAIALPLLAVSASFYYFNRYPSRIFDGDSGSLSFGAMYVILSILGGVEIAALVALIPAVLNSYYILASVRGLVERKRMAARPTFLGDDMKLHASLEAQAPTTLVRMILLGGALDEKALVRRILAITAFAAFLSVVTSVMTWLL
jgi:UDP-N-acetylglucosamine--dolichyl-phosphate N-acetylglucosaminephosphotransferase